ncbi:MAG TPA: DNA polymerase III, partial [Candidatus Bathyarchaeota archaeon]|nr:DNA polymerase III [Candidatus Bathyarchaeota archaeon]
MSVNAEVAEILYEISELYALRGEQYRSRAYMMAAQRIGSLTEDIRKIWQRGELQSIPGVGKSIAAVIEEYLETGQSSKLEELREGLPRGVMEIIELDGVGPKKAMRLYEELGINSIEELEKAAKAGKIRRLKGFGPKTEENILRSIEEYRRRQERFLLGAILPVIDEIVAYM